MVKKISTSRHILILLFITCSACLTFLLWLIVNRSNTVNPWLLMSNKLHETQIINQQDSLFPLTLIDPTGRKIELQQPPKRIASAILSGDEILDKLVSHDRIVSVTYLVDQNDYSQMSNHFNKQITRNHGHIEELLAVQPDLVLIASYTQADSVNLLLSSGIPILRITDFNSHDDLRNNVRTLARLTGTLEKADQWLASMNTTIAAIRSRVKGLPRPGVLYYKHNGYSHGSHTLIDETIQYAGGKNVLAQAGIKGLHRLSTEMAIALQPDIIITDNRHQHGPVSARDKLMQNPAWQDVPAIQQGHVYNDQTPWLLSVTPERIKGLEQVARWIHPDAFTPQISPEAHHDSQTPPPGTY